MTVRATWLTLAVATAVIAAAGCKPPTSAPSDGAPTGSGVAAKPSGAQAPDFSLRSLDGETVRLSDYIGKKVVLLDFWSTICDPCLQAMPELVKLYGKYKDRGFEILAISEDGPETLAQVRPTAHDKGMTFPVLLDEETAVLSLPTYKGDIPVRVLVDRSGSIALKNSGHTAGDTAALKLLTDSIDEALAAP